MPSSLARVTLIDLDGNQTIEAQFNPKEIQVEKGTNWKASESNNGNQPDLEFTHASSRKLAMELFFDTYERGADVHDTYVRHLVRLMDIIDPYSFEETRRPPRIKLLWGGKLPEFIGVLESVTTKYTMFLPDGTPVRATCSVKVIEASRLSWQPQRRMFGRPIEVP